MTVARSNLSLLYPTLRGMMSKFQCNAYRQCGCECCVLRPAKPARSRARHNRYWQVVRALREVKTRTQGHLSMYCGRLDQRLLGADGAFEGIVLSHDYVFE